MSSNPYRDLYDRLLASYGPQGWWPGEGPFEVIVGAILTQRTAWRNVEIAMRTLRECGLTSVAAIDGAPLERIQGAVRPAGFYRAKAETLKRFARHVAAMHDGDLAELLARPTASLRKELLGLRGIGEETVDAIVVYAARKPGFVIDAYTQRLLHRLGWTDGSETYGALRERFLSSLPRDVKLLGEFHALIVKHGKEHCRATPACAGCPVRSICSTGPSCVAVGCEDGRR